MRTDADDEPDQSVRVIKLVSSDELSTIDMPVEDGWNVISVKKKPSQPNTLKIVSSSATPSAPPVSWNRSSTSSTAADNLTKKQRENQRKLEREKAAKAEFDRLQAERLAKHRREQERSHISEIMRREKEAERQRALNRNSGVLTTAPAKQSSPSPHNASSTSTATPQSSSSSLWDWATDK
eukprot:jgi/Hompol1/6866/HPOL_004180-RA